jgi:coenzyme F420-reducing hydrogenase delta subunit
MIDGDVSRDVPVFFWEGEVAMNIKENGLSHAFFFCQQLDAAQDLNRRSLEKELGPRIRFFPLPCSGRVESLHLLRALETGADKVYVITCPEGACRHQEGNTRARKRAEFAQRLISEFGLEPDRLEFVAAPSFPSPPIDQVARELLAREIRIQPLPWTKSEKEAPKEIFWKERRDDYRGEKAPHRNQREHRLL